MSLWRSIIDGLGMRVGSELARKGIDELVTGDRDELQKREEEEKERALTSRNRKLAVVVVSVSVLGLLALSGALTAIFKWVLGAAFIVGLFGGGWYLVRNRVLKLRATMEAKRVEKIEATKVADKQKSLEEQLAELKRRKAQGEGSSRE